VEHTDLAERDSLVDEVKIGLVVLSALMLHRSLCEYNVHVTRECFFNFEMKVRCTQLPVKRPAMAGPNH
jgi:hypothetical protein